MFLCDFPYTYKGKARVTANKWDTPIDIDRFFELAKILLKPNGVIALTATNPFSSYLVNKGLDMYKYEWVWEKDNGSNFVHVKHQPFRVHETILIFGKSPTTYNKKGNYMYYDPQFTYSNPYSMKRDMSDVQNLDGFKGRTNTENKDGKRYPRSVQKFNLERGLHPTQKPVTLFSYLINTHCPKDGLVVDICCGSGTTAVSCIDTERNYIVNDLESKFCDVTIDRIDKRNSKFVC
nr:site-specific DNA-methyltransferase [Clostridioides sp.]